MSEVKNKIHAVKHIKHNFSIKAIEAKELALRLAPHLSDKIKEAFDTIELITTLRGKKAGLCSYKQFIDHRTSKIIPKLTIRINAEMASLSRDNFEEIVYDTVTHELAHAIDFLINDKSGHEEFWQKLHIYLGGSGNRYHKMEHKSAFKEFKYYFDDVPEGGKEFVILTVVRHNRVQRGTEYTFDNNGTTQHIHKDLRWERIN